MLCPFCPSTFAIHSQNVRCYKLDPLYIIALYSYANIQIARKKNPVIHIVKKAHLKVVLFSYKNILILEYIIVNKLIILHLCVKLNNESI